MDTTSSGAFLQHCEYSPFAASSEVGDECSMPGRLEELNKTYGTQPLCANVGT